MRKGQLITGVVLTLMGLVLISLPLFFSFKNGAFMGLIYGIPLFIIGLFILFNKNEDKIERRKDIK